MDKRVEVLKWDYGLGQERFVDIWVKIDGKNYEGMVELRN